MSANGYGIIKISWERELGLWVRWVPYLRDYLDPVTRRKMPSVYPCVCLTRRSRGCMGITKKKEGRNNVCTAME